MHGGWQQNKTTLSQEQILRKREVRSRACHSEGPRGAHTDWLAPPKKPSGKGMPIALPRLFSSLSNPQAFHPSLLLPSLSSFLSFLHIILSNFAPTDAPADGANIQTPILILAHPTQLRHISPLARSACLSGEKEAFETR